MCSLIRYTSKYSEEIKMEETGKKFDKVKYDEQYRKEHYDQLRVWIPKAGKEEIKRKAEEMGIPIAQLVVDAIEKTYNIVIK